MKSHYSEDEANAIIHRAIERHHQGGEMSRDQLVAMAVELGISPDTLLKAEKDVLAQRDDADARIAFQKERKREFKGHLASYLGVNLFLLLLNVLTSPGAWWFFYPLLGWGLGVFFHGLSVMNPDSECNQQKYLTWLAKRDAGASSNQLPIR